MDTREVTASEPSTPIRQDVRIHDVGAIPGANSLFEAVPTATAGGSPWFSQQRRRWFVPLITRTSGASIATSASAMALPLIWPPTACLAWFQEFISRISRQSATWSSTIRARCSNPREMPWEMLEEILTFPPAHSGRPRHLARFARALYHTPRLSVVSSRRDDITFHPILGIESSDDRIRNEVRRKAMPCTAIDRVFQDLRKLVAEFGPASVGLDGTIVIAGPGTTDATAGDDAVMTACDPLIAGVQPPESLCEVHVIRGPAAPTVTDPITVVPGMIDRPPTQLVIGGPCSWREVGSIASPASSMASPHWVLEKAVTRFISY